MLRPASYLTNGDFFADLRDAPQLDGSVDVFDAVAALLGEDSGFSRGQTVTAIRLALEAAIHLNDAIGLAVSVHDRFDLARLVSGLNLLDAYLAQTIYHLAQHVDNKAVPAFHGAPVTALQPLTASLRAAVTGSQEAAEDLKQAHAVLRRLAGWPQA